MKSLFLLILIIITSSCTRTGFKFIEKSNFDSGEIKTLHRKIAILPVNYAYNQASNTFWENLVSKENTKVLSEQVKMGYELQHAIYEEFSKKLSKLEVLSDEETNQVLAKKNIQYNDIRRFSKTELAKILDVDAVIYCDLYVGSITVQNNLPYGNVPIKTKSKIQLVEFVTEIHGNIEEEVVWKAKTTLPISYIYIQNYNRKFRDVIALDLIPILPYNKTNK